jgi:aspartyl-tRNA(Asn)/glutamyl-tRNA(Gln) amidotransferase subunit C
MMNIRGRTGMALDPKTVARVATLARIRVPESDLAALAEELSHIVSWIEQLGEADTSGVEPMTRVMPMKLPMREDAVTDGDKRAAVLANAPQATDSFFTVPKVVE